MSESLEGEIRSLRALFRSERDPGGHGFAPLADACRRAGDLAEARELVVDGLARHPNFASGHVVAAWVARDGGDAEAARRSLERVLQLDPENVVALRELGGLAEEEGQREEALSFYTRLLEIEPGDPELGRRVERLRGSEEGVAEDGSEEVFEGEREVALETAALVEAGAEPESEGAGPPVAGDLEELDLAEAAADLTGEQDAWPEEPAPEVEDEGEVYTVTMAELYVRQGLHGRAMDVYERLLEADPQNESFRRRLAEVREIIEGPPPQGEDSDEAEGVGTEEGVGADSEAEAEVLAHEVAESPAEELETPFAWSADEEEGEGEDMPGGPEAEVRTAADYFEDLLEWLPGAVAVDSLAPEAPVEEGIEAGIPDDVSAVGVELPAPEPPAAPDEAAVPIGSLAPEAGAVDVDVDREKGVEAVPIGSLAPETPAEPDHGAGVGAVPIESLAPDSPPDPEIGEGEVGPKREGDGDLDDFQKWLDSVGR